MKNYYDILGVSKDTNPDELKKAYRNLSKEHHPDRGGMKTNLKKFQKLILYSVTQIKNHSTTLEGITHLGGGGNPFEGMGGGDPFEMFREFF